MTFVTCDICKVDIPEGHALQLKEPRRYICPDKEDCERRLRYGVGMADRVIKEVREP